MSEDPATATKRGCSRSRHRPNVSHVHLGDEGDGIHHRRSEELVCRRAPYVLLTVPLAVSCVQRRSPGISIAVRQRPQRRSSKASGEGEWPLGEDSKEVHALPASTFQTSA